jgi:hypothetical protein
MEVSGQFVAKAALPQQNELGIHRIGGWVGFKIGFDSVEKRETASSSWNETPLPWSYSPCLSHYTD